MPLPTKQELQAEFHTLKKREADLQAKLAPMQAAYHKVTEEAEKHRDQYINPIIEQMKGPREELHKLQMEIGGIVKYLRGSNGIADTGDAPIAATAVKTKQ